MNITHLMKRLLRLGLFGLVLSSFLLGPIPALAHGEEVTVEPAEARHGDTITVSGTDFSANQVLPIILEGTLGAFRLGEATVDSNGTFSVQFTIPEEVTPGNNQLKVTAGDEVATVAFRVLAEEGVSEKGTHLIFERSLGETFVIAILALALVAAGTILVLTSRRRPQA